MSREVEDVTSEEPRREKVVKSDMQCPLLTDPASVDRTEVVEYKAGADGEKYVDAVHRYAEQTVVTPVACPTCGKILEDHQLCWDMKRGVRDCAIANKMRADRRYSALFAKLDAQKGRSDDPSLERLAALVKAGPVRELTDEKIIAAREAVELAQTDEEKNRARLDLARLYQQGAL